MATPKKKRTILFCIDDMPHTIEAFNWYLENLMNETRDTLIILNVTDPVNAPKRLNIKYEELTMETMDPNKPELAKSRKLCEKYVELCVQNKINHLCVVHMSKNVGLEIVNTARTKKVDMILMGSRGIGKLKRTILGSVGDYIMHNAHRPVVIIPPTDNTVQPIPQ